MRSQTIYIINSFFNFMISFIVKFIYNLLYQAIVYISLIIKYTPFLFDIFVLRDFKDFQFISMIRNNIEESNSNYFNHNYTSTNIHSLLESTTDHT